MHICLLTAAFAIMCGALATGANAESVTSTLRRYSISAKALLNSPSENCPVKSIPSEPARTGSGTPIEIDGDSPRVAESKPGVSTRQFTISATVERMLARAPKNRGETSAIAIGSCEMTAMTGLDVLKGVVDLQMFTEAAINAAGRDRIGRPHQQTGDCIVTVDANGSLRDGGRTTPGLQSLLVDIVGSCDEKSFINETVRENYFIAASKPKITPSVLRKIIQDDRAAAEAAKRAVRVNADRKALGKQGLQEVD